MLKYGEGPDLAYPLRSLFTAKYIPKFIQAPGFDSWGMIQIPLFTLNANTTIDSTYLEQVVIQMNDPNDHTTIDSLALKLQLAAPGATVSKTYETAGATSKIKKILDKVFYGLISVTMFLCFFSLSASMTANLYEQKKEVGVLRAMGFTKYRVRALYFYESLILVLTSCSLGVLIGTAVGYTMLLQFNLFLNATAEVFFPWGQFILVVILSIVCAFLSTWGPAA